jgi:DNA mismatch repair protein PMS2
MDADDAEEKLSLKISKSDFSKMKIIGQFNLGFVLAVREAEDNSDGEEKQRQDDELFIIDQHASDEKYNFERLQANTVVQSQRLVQPKTLELTAIEEEVIMENISSLETNGFKVRVDDSGDTPVGSRVQLLTLPLSRETTFSLADLEELIFLLSENPTSSATTVPRPSKVRKMFAMRACRSSIMIGRALSHRQMEKVVRNMGEMEKPRNCPHGRPTMRHLCGLGAWEERRWSEGDEFYEKDSSTDWAGWVREKSMSS